MAKKYPENFRECYEKDRNAGNWFKKYRTLRY
jgi:hypothetical protein